MKRLEYSISFIMLILILTTPILVIAQQMSDTVQAIADAKADADKDTSLGWAIAGLLTASACGCLGGSVVLLYSSIASSAPPAHRLIGKSSEYVITYTDTYQSETKRKRTLYAGGGCLGGTLVAAVVWGSYYSSQGYY